MQQLPLNEEISTVREKMYVLAKRYGYSHPEVVSCSQKLDRLLNKYHFNEQSFHS